MIVGGRGAAGGYGEGDLMMKGVLKDEKDDVEIDFILFFLQDLDCLFEIYLKPLQNETFLTQDEVGPTSSSSSRIGTLLPL